MRNWIVSLLLAAVFVAGCHTPQKNALDIEVEEPLARAILMRDYNQAVNLLEAGHPVEGRSDHRNEPAYWAIFGGDEDGLKLLIDHGLDVGYDWGERGGNLLTNAVQFGQMNVVRILIEAGASVTRDPEMGRSPLYSSIIYGHEDIEDYLRSKGAKLNAWDLEAFGRLGINLEEHRTNR
jgi:ankyrin repeat protein